MANSHGFIFLFKLSIISENTENSVYIYLIKMKVFRFTATEF